MDSKIKISGKVIHGDAYGRKIGFPTVNLEVGAEAIPPPLPLAGVYAGTGELEGKVYRAGIVVHPNSKVDAHLIGYRGDAYGNVVTLTLEKFLRPYKNFDSEEELIAQIKRDIEMCK